MDCIQGGPADRAGIHEGDELVEIDGILPFSVFLLLICSSDYIKARFITMYKYSFSLAIGMLIVVVLVCVSTYP